MKQLVVIRIHCLGYYADLMNFRFSDSVLCFHFLSTTGENNTHAK